MTRIAYFDCQFGAAGDMLNAALLSAGLNQSIWEAELRKIALEQNEFQIRISEVVRCGIVGKKLDVLNHRGDKFDHMYEAAAEARAANTQEHSHQHTHSHSHHHEHHYSHSHEHGEHAHTHEHHHHYEHTHVGGSEHEHEHNGHSHERGLTDILQLIQRSQIAEGAKSLASRIFIRLANAEARVHGGKPEDVHFHEVGAVDAIVDIVGFAIGYDLLKVEKSFCSGVAIGSGKVKTEHGIYPVPGPATLYILEEAGALIAPSRIDFECLTPTGAAIICEIVSAWGRQPAVSSIIGTGYGAGTKDPDTWPNVCRVLIGQSPEVAAISNFDQDWVIVMEANIDDMNPQALAYALDLFIAEGALDAYTIPAVMKKGRAGQLLTVICSEQDRTKFEQLIMSETTTIGIRFRISQRAISKRDWQTVQLQYGSVRVKVARAADGTVMNVQPEFDDCAKYAREFRVPVKDVMVQAAQAYNNSGSY